MTLDKNITNHLNLNKIVKLDNTRSYREGNLMYLTFEIIDKNEDAILSFVFESGRFVKVDLMSVADCVNNSKDGHNFNVQYSLCKILFWALANNLYPNLSTVEVKNRLADVNVFGDFIIYMAQDLFTQVGDIVKHLDFFSLQTKEEYIEDEKIVDEYLDSLKKNMLDGTMPLDYSLKDSFDNQYEILNNKKYESWIAESYKEALINFVVEGTSALARSS